LRLPYPTHETHEKEKNMNLQISGHHVEVTPALQEYVNSKLSPVIKHSDKVIAVTVVLSVEKLKQKAEVTVQVPGDRLFVEAADENLYAAIDALFDKLDRQLQKYKGKGQDRHRSEKAASLQMAG
jgi:putative sigma-54 modulation protein